MAALAPVASLEIFRLAHPRHQVRVEKQLLRLRVVADPLPVWLHILRVVGAVSQSSEATATIAVGVTEDRPYPGASFHSPI